jgi:plastocyanin
MNISRHAVGLALLTLLPCAVAHAADVIAHLSLQHGAKPDHATPAVIWLKPVQGDAPPVPAGKYTLLQKNKTFTPHLLIVPVGSIVSFPNADPFFHNVFSLFDGRRFDLGLYEAGSTRTVTFSREGVSYIFCNIHPDMSAAVLSLTTSYFSPADSSGNFHIPSVPEGEYELHIWVEGRRDDALNHLTRHVRIAAAGSTDLGVIEPGPGDQPPTHLNKFGKPYDVEHKSY